MHNRTFWRHCKPQAIVHMPVKNRVCTEDLPQEDVLKLIIQYFSENGFEDYADSLMQFTNIKPFSDAFMQFKLAFFACNWSIARQFLNVMLASSELEEAVRTEIVLLFLSAKLLHLLFTNCTSKSLWVLQHEIQPFITLQTLPMLKDLCLKMVFYTKCKDGISVRSYFEDIEGIG